MPTAAALTDRSCEISALADSSARFSSLLKRLTSKRRQSWCSVGSREPTGEGPRLDLGDQRRLDLQIPG